MELKRPSRPEGICEFCGWQGQLYDCETEASSSIVELCWLCFQLPNIDTLWHYVVEARVKGGMEPFPLVATRTIAFMANRISQATR